MKTKKGSLKKKATKNKLKQAKVPYAYKPEKMTLEEWQIALRKQFAPEQYFSVENIGQHPVFSDFNIYNPNTKKIYKVAIRDEKFGLNFCSCPDFKVTTLGTCKHIEYVLFQLKKKKSNNKYFKEGYMPEYSSISLRYGNERKIFLRIGSRNSIEMEKLSKGYFTNEHFLKDSSFEHFETFLAKATDLDPEFRCYQDAIDYIIGKRSEGKRKLIIDQKYNVKSDSIFKDLLNAELFPYQKEGILFAAKAGRCLIADEMGLGKTIQAIGAAELMSKEFGVEKVLVICPTSLKYQWKSEIKKFTSKEAVVIEGMASKRHELYENESFYKIASYNVIKSDLEQINKFAPDLIILDEAQRIKNWKTKTAQNVKSLSSEYAFVLTGTPLENKLEELHSIIQFIDIFRLGPLFRFLHNHQTTDDNGKVIGYSNLHEINKTLQPVLIRRNKKEIAHQLPERIDKNYFVPVTQEQMTIHNEYYDGVCKLVNKWRRFKYLSEQDRQKLLIFLNCMRMVSDSTYILDQKTRFDTKIEELMIILEEIFENKDEKVVIFSQWERMTRLVAQELDGIDIEYEYLHGGIPSEKRKDLLDNFHNKPASRVFLSTDAGGIGLNLQCASTVINLDIPWNPAVLEQRIARIHRIGQKKHVQVINFISTGSIEERILGLLGFKQSVFKGLFDMGDNNVFMGEDRFKQFMKTVEQITNSPVESMEPVLSAEENSNEIEVNQKPELITELGETIEVKETLATQEDIKTPVHVEEMVQSPAVGTNALSELFITGIDFLQKLGNSLQDTKTGKTSVSSFVEKDPASGKTYFKIPVPEEKVIEQAVTALSGLLQLFKKG